MQPRLLKHFMNVWPPFAASGIHVAHLADDWSVARVTLRLRRWNRNYVGTGRVEVSCESAPSAVLRQDEA
ncbi:DUF4442 domain-containing protein [Salinisphaera hydrothermalis]|uniref:Uncharacterized protein n=1 Tax=Salinisphaera hydrothermalis (strain C41B8) TaxID=1304275 RepID=A0A084IJH9_SALHC|nr:DUF4442 domain-containing protein [Salinisphaera hydrothermalis]KEZ76863.1 hypothetical protein C41B8_12935 [Salinisphaera hydrothermalis C41B8]